MARFVYVVQSNGNGEEHAVLLAEEIKTATAARTYGRVYLGKGYVCIPEGQILLTEIIDPVRQYRIER